MLIVCWSPKGGTGTSTSVAVLATAIARDRRVARVADFAGDQAALLGVVADGPGVNDWLAAGADAPPSAIDRLAVEVAPYLSLLPAGESDERAADPEAGDALGALLSDDAVITIADLGGAQCEGRRAVARRADVNLAVVRACYLSLRHLMHHPLLGDADGLVLITDKGRALGRRDFESTTGQRVLLDVPARPAIGRLADTGLLPTACSDEVLAPWRELMSTIQRNRRLRRAA
jgi:hypothetical protein